MSRSNWFVISLLVTLSVITAVSFAAADEILIDTLYFTPDDSVQYFWVNRYMYDLIHIKAYSDGSSWCSFDVMEYWRWPWEHFRTGRYVPGDGGDVYHYVTASMDHGANVGLRVWGGGGASHFEVFVVTDNPAPQTPWEDWWYVDPANPDYPGPGGILLDVGTDPEHPCTYLDEHYFTARLNVRRYACFGGALQRVEFDMQMIHGMNMLDYQVLAPFSGMDVQETSPDNYHVSVWADSPVSLDPVYACELTLDPPGWAMVCLSNCTFVNAAADTYPGECLAPLRMGWRFYPAHVEACTWGDIKAMFR